MERRADFQDSLHANGQYTTPPQQQQSHAFNQNEPAAVGTAYQGTAYPFAADSDTRSRAQPDSRDSAGYISNDLQVNIMNNPTSERNDADVSTQDDLSDNQQHDYETNSNYAPHPLDFPLSSMSPVLPPLTPGDLMDYPDTQLASFDNYFDGPSVPDIPDRLVKQPSWNWAISDVTQATNWLAAHPPGGLCRVSLDHDDDDVEVVSALVSSHALSLLEAIFKGAPPANRKWDEGKIAYYHNYQRNGVIAVKELTSTAHGCASAQSQCILAIEEIVELHRNGSASSSKTAKFDASLKASERVEQAIKCMDIKHLAKAVIEGSPKILRDLAHDPKGLYKARLDAAQGNGRKQECTAAGRKVKEGTFQGRKSRKATPDSAATSLAGSQDSVSGHAANTSYMAPTKKRSHEATETNAPLYRSSKRTQVPSNLVLEQRTDEPAQESEDSQSTPNHYSYSTIPPGASLSTNYGSSLDFSLTPYQHHATTQGGAQVDGSGTAALSAFDTFAREYRAQMNHTSYNGPQGSVVEESGYPLTDLDTASPFQPGSFFYDDPFSRDYGGSQDGGGL